MKKLLSVGLAAACAGAMLLACGGDDNDGNNNTSGDGGGGDANTLVDGAPVGDGGGPGTDSSPPDAGCNFAVVVTDLIKNNTTATATPSTFLGQGCIDNQDQAEFKPLFP